MSKVIAHAVQQVTRKAAPVKAAAKSVQPKVAANPVKVQIITGRPGNGHDLFTYTAAWFELFGIMDGKAIDKKLADKIAGSTAINYHIAKGRFALDGGQIKLTAGGLNHFAPRVDVVNVTDKAAWKKILTTGKADGRLIKVQENLMPL